MAILIETRLNSLKLNENASPRKGCLGRLEGVCADFKNPTRNGRLYPRKLWENVFNDTLFQESLKSKTLLGELDHPEDRLEVLAGEACIVMTDYRIDEDEGVIYAGFDILDTPRGKILKSLLDYGCVMGVSSRGQGDINSTANGEVVDEDTYDFACFDVVTTPAVAKARQNVVESVKKTRTFVESVRKQITDAETVGDLNAIKRVIETTQLPEMDTLLESIEDKCKSITEGRTTTSIKDNDLQPEVTINDTTNTDNTSAKTIRESKEMYSCLNSLRKQISAYKFREKKLLSVINSKNKELANVKESISTNTTKAKDKINTAKIVRENAKLQKNKIFELSNLLDNESKKSDYLREQLAHSNNNVESLQKKFDRLETSESVLKEKLSARDSKITSLEHTIKTCQLRESSLTQTINELQETNESLNKQLEALETNVLESKRNSNKNINDMESEINSYSTLIDNLQNELKSLKEQKDNSIDVNKKLITKCKQLTEKVAEYQKIYVDTKSKQLGIDPSLVTVHINNDTSIPQINKLMENVQKTKDRYAKLPISESVPSGIFIDSSKKQSQVKDEEMEKLTAFVEKLVSGC